jgi:hypothetical protein
MEFDQMHDLVFNAKATLKVSAVTGIKIQPDLALELATELEKVLKEIERRMRVTRLTT